MSKKNKNAPVPEQENEAVKQPKKKKKKGSGFGRFLRRFFLLLFTLILLLAVDVYLVLDLTFNGPSEAASKALTMSLTEVGITKWIPGLFLGEEKVDEICAGIGTGLSDDMTDVTKVVVDTDAADAQWAAYPDGIRIESRTGSTFRAHVMMVRDPARVSMGVASTAAGVQIEEAMTAASDAAAIISAGAFGEDGVPVGPVFSAGEKDWGDNKASKSRSGFAGFNQDHILMVSTSMTAADAQSLGIRDGCAFGPVLILNGEINMDVYNTNSGYSSRSAIGQKADGTVIFVCIDGMQAGSLGATYQDLVDILIEYGAINACGMDGNSSAMLYRDIQGMYGEAGKVHMITNYSLLHSQDSKIPNYWMVSATGKE